MKCTEPIAGSISVYLYKDMSVSGHYIMNSRSHTWGVNVM